MGVIADGSIVVRGPEGTAGGVRKMENSELPP